MEIAARANALGRITAPASVRDEKPYEQAVDEEPPITGVHERLGSCRDRVEMGPGGVVTSRQCAASIRNVEGNRSHTGNLPNICSPRKAGRWRRYWTFEGSGSTPRASNDQPASAP